MPSPPPLVEVGPDDPLFPAWCEVWAASARFDRPDEPVEPVSHHLALARQLTSPGGARDGTHRAVLEDGRVIGALRVILPTKDNRQLAILDVAVRPEHRRHGIGSALLDEGLRLSRTAGRSRLITEVDEPGPGAVGRAFAVHHGWACNLLETRRELAVPPDESRLAALEAEARAASRGYDLVTWRDTTPDELVDDRALLERRMTTDAPHGDLPVEEEDWDAARIREYEAMHVARGRTVLSAGAVKDGRLVAFTDLQVPLADPRTAQQGGTLVLREHRGHRLGALVKAAVLRQVLVTQPAVKRISTYNSESNTPMVAVNEALGFVPAGHLSTWALRLE